MSSDGANFGDVSLKDKVLQMTSINGLPCFELRLDNVAQCVVPANNRDELEIHFPENEAAEKDEDCLVQITMHFPAGEDPSEDSPAQEFQKDIMNTGVIRSITGDIICEFSKDQGNFVLPRGKYSIQMLSSYMHMQGAQYSYKIKYSDITKTFLLDKPDGMRMFFVIVLDKPIRQGSQKYQYLVIETNKMEHTLMINLTEAEIAKDYDGQLQPEMTGPLSNNMAKVFKILAQTTVFVPKQFKSFRDEFSVRCTYKTNEGLLYPLTKCLIFVHKPTIIINYEDIASVEMQRMSANTGTRAFDLEIVLKKKDGGGESKYLFVSIDRAEGSSIAEFLQTKNVTVINPQPVDKKSKSFAGMDGGDDGDDDEEEEDDGDYKAGQSSGSENDSDDSGSDEEGGGDGGDDDAAEEKPKAKKRQAAPKAPKGSPREKAPKKAKEPKEPGGKKPKKPKDKNAPKKGMTAYLMFANSNRATVKAENPGMSFQELNKMLGTIWGTMAKEDKEEFEMMADQDKQRYQEELAEYNAKLKEAGNDTMDVASDDGGDSD